MKEARELNAESKNESQKLSGGLADHEKLDVFFVLPNLQIKSPIETKFVGILPDTDPRVMEIAKRSPAVHALINGFADKHGSKCSVSAMVVHQDAPEEIKGVAALVSFRNLLAISCILNGWQRAIGNPNVFWPLYSDYFDFYPYGPSPDGECLGHVGHALRDLDTADDFRGQAYPDLPTMGYVIRATPDERIFGFLHRAWKERFENGRKNWRSNKLFRSLAIAYHASSLPKKNSLWFYDLGVTVALWISAFEILAHPGRKGASDLRAVLELLSKARFTEPVVKRRRRIKYRKQVRSGNAAEFLYWRLYEARNRFLHGTPVTPNDALYKNPTGRSSLLTHIAPLVYQVALLSYFDFFARPSDERITSGNLKLVLSQSSAVGALQQALKHVLIGKGRNVQ